MEISTAYLFSILQIIWIDLLLSGDNAVVIALACRSLPEKKRRIGIVLGAGAAVILRIIFAFVITQLLSIQFLSLLGGLLLVWIAIKLAVGEEDDQKHIKETDNLWRAVATITVADAVMSLDNVMAIAAIAKHDYSLFIFGLIISIPLIVTGASVISALISKFPLIVWAGAALLGWVAGDMISSDRALNEMFHGWLHNNHYIFAIAGAAIVVLVSYYWKRRLEHAKSDPSVR